MLLKQGMCSFHHELRSFQCHPAFLTSTLYISIYQLMLPCMITQNTLPLGMFDRFELSIASIHAVLVIPDGFIIF